MTAGFADHPRKRIVRERWDTPVLDWLYRALGVRFFYLGLPGPKIHDILLWRNMIGRVAAFELPGERDDRSNIVELHRNLALMRIRAEVYCGYLEEVILDGRDLDGKIFQLDEFVHLYNLDFTNPITGRIYARAGRRCLRFEAIRRIAAMQRHLYRETGVRSFIMLITVRDTFHYEEIAAFVREGDLPPDTSAFIRRSQEIVALRERDLTQQSMLLVAFLHTRLRQYLGGQNIKTLFLQPLLYTGASVRSPMLHLLVVCRMGEQESSSTPELQTAQEFFELPVVRASEHEIVFDSHWNTSSPDDSLLNPVTLLAGLRL